MPWVMFKQRPERLGEMATSAFDAGFPIELPLLENMINEATGEYYDPPLVMPNKKTSEWKIGDVGQFLCFNDDESHVWYNFVIVDSPIFSEELKRKAETYRKNKNRTNKLN